MPAETDISLSVAEAAARVGLTPATLRTWDRRYGLAPSLRTSGGHRRYSAKDLARLRAVGHMVDAGVPAAQAVAACLQMPAESLQDATPMTAMLGETTTARPGGGRVLPLPGGSDIQRGLARAAMKLDGGAISRTVARLISDHGVVPVWTEVLVPMLQSVGERWQRTSRGVEIEHVTSDAIARALTAQHVPSLNGQRPVLLSCMPEEQHSLALLALGAALSERGEPYVLLGSRVPADALHDAVARLRPRRLVLWAQLPELADPSVAANLPAQRPPLHVVLAGPGWQDTTGPEARPRTLPEALALLSSWP